MSDQPTKAEVEDAITRIEYYKDAYIEDCNVLHNAYLAQGEDLARLKAENHKLKTQLLVLEA